MSSLNLLSINLWPLFLVTPSSAWGEQGLSHCLLISLGQFIDGHQIPSQPSLVEAEQVQVS